ncbi:hypothetical protein [Lonepinella sp. BR2357]|uniref:hypothetical protein n=1 Tax=Lonepinella sp. BR2357 TaxID=3434549 RepID=UPI003F6DE95A
MTKPNISINILFSNIVTELWKSLKPNLIWFIFIFCFQYFKPNLPDLAFKRETMVPIIWFFTIVVFIFFLYRVIDKEDKLPDKIYNFLDMPTKTIIDICTGMVVLNVCADFVDWGHYGGGYYQMLIVSLKQFIYLVLLQIFFSLLSLIDEYNGVEKWLLGVFAFIGLMHWKFLAPNETPFILIVSVVLFIVKLRSFMRIAKE